MNTREVRLLFLKLEEIETHLKEIKAPSGWLDLQGASQYSSLSVSTLKRGVQSGALKCSRQRGKLLFRRGWIDKFILYGKQRLLSVEKMGKS